MTKPEFDLIADLLKSSEPVISGVRLVIFDGQKNAQAARLVGVTPQSLHRSTARFLALHKEISKVYSDLMAHMGKSISAHVQNPRPAAPPDSKGLSALQTATLDALEKSMRRGEFSDANCVEMLGRCIANKE